MPTNFCKRKSGESQGKNKGKSGEKLGTTNEKIRDTIFSDEAHPRKEFKAMSEQLKNEEVKNNEISQEEANAYDLMCLEKNSETVKAVEERVKKLRKGQKKADEASLPDSTEIRSELSDIAFSPDEKTVDRIRALNLLYEALCDSDTRAYALKRLDEILGIF